MFCVMGPDILFQKAAVRLLPGCENSVFRSVQTRLEYISHTRALPRGLRVLHPSLVFGSFFSLVPVASAWFMGGAISYSIRRSDFLGIPDTKDTYYDLSIW